MVTWRELVAEAVVDLTRSDVPDPETSAQHIGRRASGADGADWLTAQDDHATRRQVAALDSMLARRRTGEPLQYVIGSWGFRHLDLFVDSRVLIPRPETEMVAGHAIDEVRRLLAGAETGTAGAAGAERLITVADLGTGSGAVGLSVAFEEHRTEVWLTDVSADALAVARANVAGIGRAGSRVRVGQGDWFDALPPSLVGRLGVVVSNPPYVGADDDVDPQTAWEPSEALFAADTGRTDGVVGTEHLEKLITTSPDWLTDAGALVLEMAPSQIEAMAQLASPRFATVQKIKDLSGRQRAIVGRFPLRS